MYEEKVEMQPSELYCSAHSEVDEPRKRRVDAVLLQERSESRNGHLDCRLMYVPEQVCARVSYLDKAHSSLPAWVHFPAGEECLMSFSDPSC